MTSLKFWLAALVAIALLALIPRRRTTWFGLLNLGVLGLWLGLPIAGAAAAFTLVVWLGVVVARRSATSGVGRALGGGVVAFLVTLFVLHKLNLEYAAWVAPLWQDGLGRIPGSVLSLLGALSFSYVVLRAYALATCVVFHKARLVDPLSAIGYLFPFHMLLSGPITAYSEYLQADTTRPDPQSPRWLLAANDVTTGLVYKYVLAEYLRAFAFGFDPIRVESVWDTSYLFLYIFFDFAGYSRIALGLGRALGIPTPENFLAPFAARSVTEFFTRWHISLGKFIARNIYNPLQLKLVRAWGVKHAARAGIVSLLAGWVFVGLWHRLSMAFLLYGLGMAACLWLEKSLRDRALKQRWSRHPVTLWATRVLGPIYVFALLSIMLYPVSREIFAP